MSQEKLHAEIIERSNATDWERAVREWTLDHIWFNDDPQTCLCGHQPIKEICQIVNGVNGNYAEVGNCCIKKFFEDLDSNGLFTTARNVISGRSSSYNEEMIRFAFAHGIITLADRNFYWDIWRKRKLSVKQSSWKDAINRKIRVYLETPKGKWPKK